MGTVLLVIVRAIVLVIALGITGTVVIKTGGDRIVSAETASGDAQCILVLGASVLADGTPSGIASGRIDRGIGSTSRKAPSHHERRQRHRIVQQVLAMKNHAISKGVPSMRYLLRPCRILYLRACTAQSTCSGSSA